MLEGKLLKFAKASQRLQSTLSLGPRAPFANHVPKEKSRPVNFDKNMPMYVKPKAWEKDGLDKEEWFKKKHAYHHVLQKPARERSNLRYQGIDEKKKKERMEEFSIRESSREHKTHLKKLRSNPQIDYLFGTNAVLAALKAGKRARFGKLHIHNPKDLPKVNEILKLAKEKNVSIKESSKQDLNILTDNAVHNGIVLESRPCDALSINCMLECNEDKSFNVKAGDALLGEEIHEFITDSYGKRQPFGIYLDEISDPHNVGAVLRSAYFLGADFVVFSERNCASLTPVVAKASSGAMEFMDLFRVAKPLTFFDQSIKNGWKFISTVGPTDKRNNKKLVDVDSIKDILQKDPVILVVGSEGSGIRTNLINKSEHVVAINNGREMNECVDSLNVSVATALLVSKILQ
ncbi:hypothetical protein CANINC_002629 [Pichia inconspicua]|uniref:rRNA methyltransferase 1, mitochondrial n=1 Tax=Pichia inconspicua TaxID=52247 RepID=A0A4V4NFN6_9ASCO|nr:hypothetical protein CANINC_002629 [[Candida] inconspicua]